MFAQGHTPTHKGRTTTTDPIKDLEVVRQIKASLSVRDRALWSLAVNSALRAGDLVRLRWIDLHDDGQCITLRLLEGKTKKPRTIPLNEQTSSDLRAWRAFCESEFIYSGQRGALTTATWGRLVKDWCKRAGLEGNFSAHTTRKTFVRLQLDVFNTPLYTLMHVLNHSTERQTLKYAGRLADDVAAAYSHSL